MFLTILSLARLGGSHPATKLKVESFKLLIREAYAGEFCAPAGSPACLPGCTHSRKRASRSATRELMVLGRYDFLKLILVMITRRAFMHAAPPLVIK